MDDRHEISTFLGRGWSFPLAFGRGGHQMKMVESEEVVGQSLKNLLTTSAGERAMRSDYGCDLRDFQFEEASQYLNTQIQQRIEDAIRRYEPRVVVESIQVKIDVSNPHLLMIHLKYMVKATNSRYNLVYPFYLQEGSGASQ